MIFSSQNNGKRLGGRQPKEPNRIKIPPHTFRPERKLTDVVSTRFYRCRQPKEPDVLQ